MMELKMCRTRSMHVLLCVTVICCFMYSFIFILFSDTKIKKYVFNVGYHSSFSQRPELSGFNWTVSEKNRVFILGASGVNTTSEWDTFHVYGQWYYRRFHYYNKAFMKCCFIFNDMETIQTTVNAYVKPLINESYNAKLKIWFVTCPNPRKGQQPEWVSIATYHIEYNCNSFDISYVKPYFPVKQNNGSLVIGTKLAYANINAEMVVSWMETYIYFGVNKIVTYKLKGLNMETEKVLDYYSSTGFLDLHLHDLADETNLVRNMSYKGYQTWSDQQVIMLDYFKRYSGFTFSGIIDHDEFLIPAKNRTLKEMLIYLFAKKKDASSYKFKSQFFITSGEKLKTNEFLKQYNTRSADGPIWDRAKLLSKTTDLLPGPVTSHFVRSRPGTRTFDCPVDVGYIRHYRKCVLGGENSECKPNVKHVRDSSMSTWAKHIETNVKHVLKTVLNKQ